MKMLLCDFCSAMNNADKCQKLISVICINIWINYFDECLGKGKLIVVKRHCFSWIWCYKLIFLKTTAPRPPHSLWYGLELCEFQAFYGY
jgi:hypothetical protein